MKHVTVFDSAGAKVRLDNISTRPPGKIQKAEAQARFQEVNDELFALQDLMWGAKTHSLLVVRVQQLVKKSVWKLRYGHINDFESLLAEHGCILLKFFLHISPEEQEQRLLAREKDPLDAWKLSVQDWKDREKWEEFTEAYEDAISRCAAPHAPWMVVPSDAKWFRDLAVAETLVAALRPYRREWQKTLEERGKVARAALEAFRKEQRQKERGTNKRRAVAKGA